MVSLGEWGHTPLGSGSGDPEKPWDGVASPNMIKGSFTEVGAHVCAQATSNLAATRELTAISTVHMKARARVSTDPIMIEQARFGTFQLGRGER